MSRSGEIITEGGHYFGTLGDYGKTEESQDTSIGGGYEEDDTWMAPDAPSENTPQSSRSASPSLIQPDYEFVPSVGERINGFEDYRRRNLELVIEQVNTQEGRKWLMSRQGEDILRDLYMGDSRQEVAAAQMCLLDEQGKTEETEKGRESRDIVEEWARHRDHDSFVIARGMAADAASGRNSDYYGLGAVRFLGQLKFEYFEVMPGQGLVFQERKAAHSLIQFTNEALRIGGARTSSVDDEEELKTSRGRDDYMANSVGNIEAEFAGIAECLATDPDGETQRGKIAHERVFGFAREQESYWLAQYDTLQRRLEEASRDGESIDGYNKESVLKDMDDLEKKMQKDGCFRINRGRELEFDYEKSTVAYLKHLLEERDRALHEAGDQYMSLVPVIER